MFFLFCKTANRCVGPPLLRVVETTRPAVGLQGLHGGGAQDVGPLPGLFLKNWPLKKAPKTRLFYHKSLGSSNNLCWHYHNLLGMMDYGWFRIFYIFYDMFESWCVSHCHRHLYKTYEPLLDAVLHGQRATWVKAFEGREGEVQQMFAQGKRLHLASLNEKI